MNITKIISRNLYFIFILLIVSFSSCSNDDFEVPPRPSSQLPEGCKWKWDYDDREWERECDGGDRNGKFGNRNNPPSEKLPIGCHWEWEDDEQKWERDCD